ncbi:restriction endonuclease subunit S [Escherichia coli]|nr:restriction endonuclease subunit S [Escherichia coli]EFM4655720.1 restriction endonuclease subunit S [Escherichia coli]EHF0075355.1 restriction endonuclease subunit S [Escherichia coli]HBE5852110.1 restriction endonuclease subunit S [Escherichia coli]
MESLALMPKYEAYKNSGVEWLGAIPVHWNSFPLCAKSKLKSISNNENEELLSVYLDKGVIKFDDVDAKRTNATSSDLTKYQLVEPGDFVLNNQQAWRGSVGVSDYRGIVSPAYLVLSLSEDIVPRFGNYLFRDGAMVANYLVSSKGVGTIQRNLYWPQLKRALVFLPPTEEQTRIANFLDKKIALIDEAISIKEKQISLLKERKQIIIQQAVTQGLDPNVPMKDSGVDWIGKIPAHWDLVKLGSCLSPVSVKNSPELPLLSITREQGVIERDVDDQESNHNFIPDDLRGYKKLEKGQFGMNKMKAWQGSYGVSKFTGIVSPAYFVFDLTKAINPEFFNWAIRSKLYVSFFGSASDGVRIGQWDLSKARMKVIPFVLPSEEEQLLIAKHLDEKLEQVDVAIKIKLQQIERLREYRSSLINSAVTGKIKITPEMVEQ